MLKSSGLAKEFARFTPLSSGISNNSVCSLLEIGDICLLLDCGFDPSLSPTLLERVNSALLKNGKVINAVLISHADMHHIGSLPHVFGKRGFAGTPIICTLPVYKFGQMVLYDYFLNREMEGVLQTSEKIDASPDALLFNLDDVDECMAHVTTVKFSQSIQVHSASGSHTVNLTAHPSGRTIGGSTWSISYGSTDILYGVDINLKKELVLDGISFEELPTTPALFITDDGGLSAIAASASSISSLSTGTSVAGGRKKKDTQSLVTGVATLINAIMDTVRGDGHVLLPCETGGRALELMQQLGSHWASKNLGMYHLVLLSPMAHNIMEFCRSQLEWMSDSLSRSFYNGKPNPFDLPFVKVFTNVREMEKQCVGPKVVIATDSSLSCGCAKELLLKWGGDPRCRVIFTDASDTNSIAHQLRTKAPPVVITVTKPVRVELSGEELATYRAEKTERERLIDEQNMKKKREAELESLAEAGLEDDEDTDAEDFDEENAVKLSSYLLGSAGAVSREASANNLVDGEMTAKKRKLQTSLISKFVQPNFVMFESKPLELAVDDYGASIGDLNFQDIASTQIQRPSRERYSNSLKRGLSSTQRTSTNATGDGEGPAPSAASIAAHDIPSKLVATTMKFQITCGIREINLSGRADTKGIRTLVSKVSPRRVVIVGSSTEDCKTLASQIRSSSAGTQVFTPQCEDKLEFPLDGERIRMQVESKMLDLEISTVKGAASAVGSSGAAGGSSAGGSSSGSGDGITCTISPLVGYVQDVTESGLQYGTRLVRLLPLVASSSMEMETDMTSQNAIGDDSTTEAAIATAHRESALQLPTAAAISQSSGAVSVGEVMLSSLKLKLEQKGITVEFRLGGPEGGTLICGSQVLIRKTSENDFVIEGPPIAVYFDVRKVVYEHFAFI